MKMFKNAEIESMSAARAWLIRWWPCGTSGVGPRPVSSVVCRGDRMSGWFAVV